MPDQRSITSFFTPRKRKIVSQVKNSGTIESTKSDTHPLSEVKDEPAISHKPQLSTSSRAGKKGLKLYEHGSEANLLSSADPEYQRKFRHHFLGKAPIKSHRREMKPYDLQFIELKKENMEAILMVQNGYKYQILGEDAYRVARFLGRSPISGWRSLEPQDEDGLYDRFASLTFPIERLPYYVEKLVMQGLKVSVAKQVETSALKAQGSNKRGPFKRQVTNTYTKGTMVEELTSTSPVSGHILALYQHKRGISMVACQPATGNAVYDEFDNTEAGMELETRLMHIQPSEILIVGSIEGVPKRIIQTLDVRIVDMNLDTGDFSSPPSGNTDPLGTCWAALRQYLSEFNLTSALSLKAKPFSLQSYMYLNGDTLNSLEIYENQTTKKPLGSLFWVLDNTVTPFGKRLLRSWIGKPLLNRELLAERMEAMEEIMYADDTKLTMLQSIQAAMKRLPDLERYTLQIYHSRIQPKQLYWYLYFFNLIVHSFTEPQLNSAKISSPKLQHALSKLNPLRSIVTPLLARIDSAKVRNFRDQSVDVTVFFDQHYFLDHDIAQSENNTRGDDNEYDITMELKDTFNELKDTKLQISQCRHSFEAYLADESQKLGIALKHVNAMGEEDTFVIGIPKKDASKAPTSWRRQGAITTEVRFWSPVSLEKTKVLKPLLETEVLLAQNLYDLFVQMIAQKYFDTLRECVNALSELDCLCSLALVSSRPNYVKPDIVDQPCLEISDGRHPMLEQLMLSNYVPNSTNMYATKNRVMIITGANMGGKSSFVRQVALLVIMAQIGCYIPASSARISIMDAVYTRMGAFDNLLRGESTFMVELKECSSILAKASPRSLVILDEVGRGTSTMDGVAIANAVLQYMIEHNRSFTLFITHYQWLCEVSKEFAAGLVQNWSMDCAEMDDEVTFLYNIVPHEASRSYGINVARLAGLAPEILNAAQSKSAEFEETIESRRSLVKLGRAIKDFIEGKVSPQKFILEEVKTDEFTDDGSAENNKTAGDEVDETQA